MSGSERWHGTSGGYTNHHCRCTDCRKAWATYFQIQTRRRAAKVTPDDPRHGTASFYRNHGCRCADCLRAHSMQRRNSGRPYTSRAESAARKERRELLRSLKKSFDFHYTIDTNGCWLWKAQSVTWKGESARRYSYRTYNANIPPHRQIKTSCGQRSCVNPAHLYIVEQFVRVSSGRRASNFDTDETCSNGHALVSENIRVRGYDGHRECVQCNRDRCKRYRAAKRLAA